MAITNNALTSGLSTTDANSYATASVTPTANRLVILCVRNRKAGGGDTPTATGNSLTWVQMGTVLSGGGTQRITFFRAMSATPTAGAITIDFGGVTQTACSWSVSEFDGVLTTGTDGADAVSQPTVCAAGQSGLTVVVTLAAFGHVNNGAFGFFFHPFDEVSVEGSGFTAIHNQSSSENNNNIFTEWRADNDTTVDATWATSMGVNEAKALAVELVAEAASGNAARSMYYHLVGGVR